MANMVDIDDLTAFQTAMATKGFAIYPNGGGLSAWKRDLRNIDDSEMLFAPMLLITNEDGDSHTIRDGESWFVGLHWPENIGMGQGYIDNLVCIADNRDLIRSIDGLSERWTLAWHFAAILRDWHSPEQWASVRHANSLEPADNGVCHSHAFFDSNEAMNMAFVLTFNRAIVWHSEIDDAAADEQAAIRNTADADHSLIQHAWDAAKVFFMSAAWEGKTTDELTAELAAWAKQNGLAHESADKMLHGVYSMADYCDSRERQAMAVWLESFIETWDKVQAFEDCLSKTRVQPADDGY